MEHSVFLRIPLYKSYLDIQGPVGGSQCPHALLPDLTELQAGNGGRGRGWGRRMVGAVLTTCPCTGRHAHAASAHGHLSVTTGIKTLIMGTITVKCIDS